MHLRVKLIRRLIFIAVLLIAVICIVYYGMDEKNNTEKKPPVILSYDEIMNTPQIKNGHLLFHDSCASCHAINKTDDLVSEKIVDNDYDKNVLYAFIRNGDSVIQSGNVYYNNLYKKYGIRMTSFPNLSDSAFENIMLYIKTQKFIKDFLSSKAYIFCNLFVLIKTTFDVL